MIKRIIKKLHKLYYTSSSARYIQYLRDNGVKVGDNTKVLDPKKIQVDISRPELLEIGENVSLHRGTIILTHDWASWCFVNLYNEFIPSHGKIKIGNNVWLGENVSILKGVTIGDNVIIGIGSVVTKNIPSNSIAVGCPAHVIGSIEDYYKKRKAAYAEACIQYAISIIESGREPQPKDFYDDYPCFVDGTNYEKYNFPYYNIFNPERFKIWKERHKATFNGFDEMMRVVKERIKVRK